MVKSNVKQPDEVENDSLTPVFVGKCGKLHPLRSTMSIVGAFAMQNYLFLAFLVKR
jgi:hypothetical protein